MPSSDLGTTIITSKDHARDEIEYGEAAEGEESEHDDDRSRPVLTDGQQDTDDVREGP